MKIVCSDCSQEFYIQNAEKIEVMGTQEIHYGCPCGGDTWVIKEEKL